MPKNVPAVELAPTPLTVAELVTKLVVMPWPRSVGEREVLFTELEFTSGKPLELENDDFPHQITELGTALGGAVRGSWDTYKQEFLGITLHLYSAQEPRNHAARAGFDELRSQLSQEFGQPKHPWEDEETPPCLWEANGRIITAHLFTHRDSSVMLSVEDAVLASIADDDSISG